MNGPKKYGLESFSAFSVIELLLFEYNKPYTLSRQKNDELKDHNIIKLTQKKAEKIEFKLQVQIVLYNVEFRNLSYKYRCSKIA